MQLELYDLIYSWRDVLDDWQKTHGGETKIMMTEAYANITFTMKYYHSDDGTRKGSHMPFNFLMITDLNKFSKAQDFVYVISKWMNYMPAGETANWVVSMICCYFITCEKSMFNCSLVTMTTHESHPATDRNALMH